MADATQEVRSNDAADKTSVAKIDMKFEIVVIPVSDIDRAKEFYARLGWRLDADYDNGKDFRAVRRSSSAIIETMLITKDRTNSGCIAARRSPL